MTAEIFDPNKAAPEDLYQIHTLITKLGFVIIIAEVPEASHEVLAVMLPRSISPDTMENLRAELHDHSSKILPFLRLPYVLAEQNTSAEKCLHHLGEKLLTFQKKKTPWYLVDNYLGLLAHGLGNDPGVFAAVLELEASPASNQDRLFANLRK